MCPKKIKRWRCFVVDERTWMTKTRTEGGACRSAITARPTRPVGRRRPTSPGGRPWWVFRRWSTWTAAVRGRVRRDVGENSAAESEAFSEDAEGRATRPTPARQTPMMTTMLNWTGLMPPTSTKLFQTRAAKRHGPRQKFAALFIRAYKFCVFNSVWLYCEFVELGQLHWHLSLFWGNVVGIESLYYFFLMSLLIIDNLSITEIQ